jgi:hypothetical protein
MSFSDLDDILGFGNPNNLPEAENSCRNETYFRDQFTQIGPNPNLKKTKSNLGEIQNDPEWTNEVLSKLTKITSPDTGRLNFFMGCFAYDKLDNSSLRRAGVDLGPFTLNKNLKNCAYSGLSDQKLQVNLINLFEWIGINTAETSIANFGEKNIIIRNFLATKSETIYSANNFYYGFGGGA